jgi:sugar lactone lactonase YvrE
VVVTSRIRAGSLALGVAVLGAAACSEPPAPTLDDPVAWLEARLAERPGDGLLLYTLARYAERGGDVERAIARLTELAAAGWDGGLERSDFPGASARPEFAALAERLDALERRVSRAEVVRELELPGLGPEGTAWDSERRELLLSSGIRRTVVAVDEAGIVRDLFPASHDGVFAVLGLEVDSAGDRLWAATAVAPFMDGHRAEDDGRSSLVAVDLASGAVAAVFEAPARPSMLNDLTVAGDGTVYVTDSAGGRIWRLRSGASALEPVDERGEWIGPNGIVLASDGRRILVADFLGLSLLDPDTGEQRRLASPDDFGSLGGIDGLDRAGASLIAIQNVAGRGRVLRIALDTTQTRVASVETLESANALFVNPTTGAVAGDRFLFLANPGAQTPSGSAAAGADPSARLVLLGLRLG